MGVSHRLTSTDMRVDERLCKTAEFDALNLQV